jgi:hypothetical protein
MKEDVKSTPEHARSSFPIICLRLQLRSVDKLNRLPDSHLLQHGAMSYSDRLGQAL